MFYSEKEAREKVILAGLELIKEKLIARTWGNVSARISDDEFIITPSGRAYDSLEPEDLVKVRISDLSYSGDIKPSSEKGLHAACYKLRQDCNFIIHTHQFYASAICAEEKDTEFAPCAEYGLSGTKKLRKNVARSVSLNPDKNCFLMAKHGAVILGKTFEDSFVLARELEENCRLLFEREKHEPLKGAFIDDYAQMFDKHGKANPGEDEFAIKLVSDKNTAAASYVKTGKKLPALICLLEHFVYTKKYSKLKDGKK